MSRNKHRSRLLAEARRRRKAFAARRQSQEERSGIGLGCMSVSGQYDNGVPLAEHQATVFFKGVYEAGCRHFDTAEVYKSGSLKNIASAQGDASTVYNEAQLGRYT